MLGVTRQAALPVVIDADGVDALAEPDPPTAVRAILQEALGRDRDVLVPAEDYPHVDRRTPWVPPCRR